jgi:glycosyltransferase involved in cell wall biosynthesis
VDILYLRLEWQPRSQCRLAISPYRQLIRNPPVVWEFNTVPEYGRLLGHSEAEINQSIQNFKRLGQGCDIAFCVSRALADYVQEKLDIKRVAVVPNGSDPEVFRPDVPPVHGVRRPDDGLNVVWIGSGYIAWHDFDSMITAADILSRDRRGRNICFHLIGSVPDHISKAPPNVVHHGPKRYSELPRWLAGMDVGLALYKPGPAFYGPGLKVFDYMASGLAVIATEYPEMEALFKQMTSPNELVPHDDSASLAEALRKLATDPERVRLQGLAGRRLIVQKYNWARAVCDTLKEIESLL